MYCAKEPPASPGPNSAVSHIRVRGAPFCLRQDDPSFLRKTGVSHVSPFLECT